MIVSTKELQLTVSQASPSTYPVYRNVMDDPYSAANDGTGDQTAAIQNAISYTSTSGGSRQGSGVTTQPAQVYLPSGTYTLGSTLNLLVNTIIMGDPNVSLMLRDRSIF
ncbi:MAG: glycosyl hydrolase family 28-related protein [Janthinobacterium lividum]